MLWRVPAILSTEGSVVVVAERMHDAMLAAARLDILGIQPKIGGRFLPTGPPEPCNGLMATSYVVPGSEGKAVSLVRSPRTEVHTSVHAFNGHIGKVVIEVKRDGLPIQKFFLQEEP